MFIDRPKLRDIADKITEWLSPDGFDCLDTEWDPPTRTLRVYVDHPRGVGFEQCTAVSHKLVEIQELDDLIPCEFSLEISSPGIERPLRTTQHFLEAMQAGARIEVKLTEKHNNRRNGVGIISEITDDDVVTMKTAEGIWTFPLTLVLKATRLADWENVAMHEQPSV